MTVSDVEQATAFYRNQLGLKYLFSAPPALSFFDCDGLRLMLNAPEGDSPASENSVLYFRVPDIHQAHEVLQEPGVIFDDSPHLIARMSDHELWMAFFRDPDKNLLGIMAELPLS